MSMERRSAVSTLELRTTGTDARLTGYASVFGAAYQVGSFTETIALGAFAGTLGTRPDVRLLIDHEGQPLARTKSGTLRLAQDAKGLRVEASLDTSDPDVQRLLPKMRRGDLDQMSFAFRIPPGGDTWNADYSERTINRIDLEGGDVSVVTYPASPSTPAALETLSARQCQARAGILARNAMPGRTQGRGLDLAVARAIAADLDIDPVHARRVEALRALSAGNGRR